MSFPPLFPDLPPVPAHHHAFLGWHLRIAEGLPMQLFRDLTEKGMFPKGALTEIVFGRRAAPKKEVLDYEQGNVVFRVLVSLERARGAFHGDVSKAVAWLTNSQGALKGRVPVELLATSMGYDYVRTAIERLTPA